MPQTSYSKESAGKSTAELSAKARELALRADTLHAQGKHRQAHALERERLGIELELDKRTRVCDMWTALKLHGTLELVGQEYGITRERVRQLLTKGVRYGWIAPFNYEAVHVEVLIRKAGGRERILAVLEECIPEGIGLSTVNERLGLRPFSPMISETFASEIEALRASRGTIEERMLERYRQYERTLGFSPNSTWIFKRDRYLYAWLTGKRPGGFPKFCADYGIKPRYTGKYAYLTERNFQSDDRGENSIARRTTSEEVLALYKRLTAQLGYSPNSEELRSSADAAVRHIFAHVQRYEGGFSAWFRRHGIKPKNRRTV